MATKSKPSDKKEKEAVHTSTESQKTDDRSAINRTMEATNRASRDVGGTVHNVLHETIDLTEQAGTDLGRIARNAAIGLVGGVRDVIGATVTGSGRRTCREIREMRSEDRV